jgi:hypothetical protein
VGMGWIWEGIDGRDWHMEAGKGDLGEEPRSSSGAAVRWGFV